MTALTIIVFIIEVVLITILIKHIKTYKGNK